MGSLEEEQLVQMVHDFIESESPASISSSSPIMFPSFSKYRQLPSSTTHLTQLSALQEILRCSTETEAERVVLEIVLKCIIRISKRDVDPKTSTGLKKWVALILKMNGFNASLCQTSWATSLGCPAGDYEYIDINVMKNEKSGSGDQSSMMRVIVDIDFKSQFEVARPTPSYKQLTDGLPSIFVGSEEKLNKIVTLLCSAAKQSLREAGLHVPPWRTTTYMLSKWLKVAAITNIINASFGRENTEQHSLISEWSPPMVKPKRRDFGGGSALSIQLSNMSINCC